MGHVGVLGRERRRRWSDAEKISVLERVGVNGRTVTDVAREADLTRQPMPNVTPIDSAETYTIAYVNDALIAVVPDGDTDALDDAIKLHIDMCMARDMDPEEPIIHRDLTLYEITYDAEEDGAAIMWSDRDTVAALPPSAA